MDGKHKLLWFPSEAAKMTIAMLGQSVALIRVTPQHTERFISFDPYLGAVAFSSTAVSNYEFGYTTR